MGRIGALPNRGYCLLRIVLAAILLTAAALKCQQLATEPTIGTGLLESHWFLIATVEFELFFGLWLLANIWAKPTWAAALACFIARSGGQARIRFLHAMTGIVSSSDAPRPRITIGISLLPYAELSQKLDAGQPLGERLRGVVLQPPARRARH